MDTFERDLALALERSLFETCRYAPTHPAVDLIAEIFLSNLSPEYSYVCEKYFDTILQKIDLVISKHRVIESTLTATASGSRDNELENLRDLVDEWLQYMTTTKTHLNVNFSLLSEKVLEFEKIFKVGFF